MKIGLSQGGCAFVQKNGRQCFEPKDHWVHRRSKSDTRDCHAYLPVGKDES